MKTDSVDIPRDLKKQLNDQLCGYLGSDGLIYDPNTHGLNTNERRTIDIISGLLRDQSVVDTDGYTGDFFKYGTWFERNKDKFTGHMLLIRELGCQFHGYNGTIDGAKTTAKHTADWLTYYTGRLFYVNHGREEEAYLVEITLNL